MTAAFSSLADAIAAHVHDGDEVALEGFTHLIPFAAAHEIIRQERRDLTLIRMTPDIVYDQMIGAGCASKLIFSWGGNPGVGSLHRMRDAVQNSWPVPLDIEEHSHAGMATRWQAGASGLPFGTLRGYAGTSLLEYTDTIGTVTCPFTGEVVDRRPRAQSRRRHHPCPAGRPARQRHDVGDHGRAAGVRAGEPAVDRHGRGGRRFVRAPVQRRGAPGLDDRQRGRGFPAVRTRRTRTATRAATTSSTRRGTRSRAIARRSRSG